VLAPKLPENTKDILSKIFAPKGLLFQKLPNFEWRPCQLEMAVKVSQAITEKKTVIIEAGTGTGKTLAYVIPAILSGKKVVISTGTKGLQDQLFYKDIPLIKKILRKDFKAVYLKGRRNYLCLWRFNQALKSNLLEETKEIKALKDWLKQTNIGDIAEAPLPPEWPGWQEFTSSTEQCLGQTCPFWDKCFITKTRLEAQKAPLIIVNHHLFMADLAVRDRGYTQVIPSYEAVIFDEAHKLEEIVSEYFGYQVSNYRIAELIRDIRAIYKTLPEKVIQVLSKLQQQNEHFFALFNHIKNRESLNQVASSFLLSEGNALKKALNRLEEVIHVIFQNSLFEETEKNLKQRIRDIKKELEFICAMKESDYAYWVEKKKRNIVIGCSPIRVDVILQKRLYPFIKTIIFTSATLNTGDNFSFFKNRLGLPSDTEGLILPSPFDFKHQALLYLPPQIPEPNEPGFLDAVVKEIIKILRISQGRALVLFTSIQNMQQVYQRVAPQAPFRSLMQGELSIAKMLKVFKKDIHSVIFATASFWEGIDVPGEALSCVIIDRLPFAVPDDPLIKARIDWFRKIGKKPFWEYQVPQAIISLRQGLGRLIRHRQDRGVLVIFDPRLYTKSYGQYFLKNLPSCPITRNIKDVEAFFKTN